MPGVAARAVELVTKLAATAFCIFINSYQNWIVNILTDSTLTQCEAALAVPGRQIENGRQRLDDSPLQVRLALTLK